jgi:hypothetical protein
LATLLAEYKSRKAIHAPPLIWSGHATLAHCHSRCAFRLEEATQVRVNLGNKLFHEGALGLRATSNSIKAGEVG